MSSGKWLLILLTSFALAGCGADDVEAPKEEPDKTELADLEQEDMAEEEDASGEILWNGVPYVYNEHLSNFLFLGIDQQEFVETSEGQLDAGQSDAIFLLSWDRVTGDMTVISIPRDTITTYNYYTRDGSKLGTVTDHLSLAYAYGDGKHKSCQFAKDAVSNLFYGLSIQSYCAVSLQALPKLLSGIGQLVVTIPNNSLENKNPDWKEGTELILNGENIETFIRYRDITVSQSAILRLERQEAFLKAYGEQAKEQFRKDPAFVARTYAAVEPYMVTNMGNDQFLKLMESAASNGNTTEWTIPGVGVEGANYDEFHVDDEALYEKIMETFYVEAE